MKKDILVMSLLVLVGALAIIVPLAVDGEKQLAAERERAVLDRIERAKQEAKREAVAESLRQCSTTHETYRAESVWAYGQLDRRLRKLEKAYPVDTQ